MAPRKLTGLDGLESTGEFDEAFASAFLEEIEDKKEWTERPEEQWRPSGKSSKLWPDKEDPSWWLTQGPKMLDLWKKWFDSSGLTIWTTPTGKPGIELEIETSIGRELYRCIIDLLAIDPDDDLVIVDWKSGAMKPPSHSQLGEYAAAVEVRYGVRPSHGAYYDARKGELGELKRLDAWTPQRVEQMLARSRRIKDKHLFVPNPSSLCSSCGVREWCYVQGGAKADEVPEF